MGVSYEENILDKGIAGFLIIIIAIVVIFWIGQRANLWINGIGIIANDVEDYYYTAFPVDGEYSVEIDLNDLESNEGKVLFDDGESEIYVSEVIFRNDNYELHFRSSGKFDMGGASLVSAIEHPRTDLGVTTKEIRAKVNGTYNGKTFKLWNASLSSLNYRDGDSFGYYLIPEEAEIELDLEKESVMMVTVSNLYMNLWAKKSF